MKKIAIITDSLSSGGVAKVALTLGSIFENDNLSVTIYSIIDEHPPSNFSAHYKIRTNVARDSYFKRLRNIYLELKESEYDYLLVLTMGRLSVFASVIAVLLRKTKCMVCEHIAFNSYSAGIKILKLLTYLLYDRIIVLTNHDKNLLGKIFNTVSIYNPSPFGIIESAKLCYSGKFLAVGHLIHRKGYDRLLPIWKIFEDRNPNAHLTIVGCGEKYDELIHVINTQHIKNIKFIDKTNEIERYYQSHDVLLCTSRAEGLPMTFIEAQSYGMPIISYDIETGPSEIIDGTNGFLISNSDENGFLDAMKKIQDVSIFKGMSQSSLLCAKKFSPGNILNDWKRQFDGR